MMKVIRVLLLTSLPLMAAMPLHSGAAASASLPGPTAPQEVSLSGMDVRNNIEANLLEAAPTLRPEALRAALTAFDTLRSRGEVVRDVLTVIDYGLPSKSKRMWVFDLASERLLFHELVAHGRNSGEDIARSFSNVEGSYQTSLGAFVTGASYIGRNGYSMRLRGMEPGLNDRAEARAIVVHGAPYVSEAFARKQGRIGRSHGCPAVRTEITRTLIDEVKDQSLLYAWHPPVD